MAPVVHTLICLLATLFVACYCIPIKPQSPDQGATDECYGTECYYYDTDYPTDTTVNVNFPENLTEAVLLALPKILSSQSEMVTLQNKTVNLLDQRLKDMEASMESIDHQIQNMTATMSALMGNMANILQTQLDVLSKRVPTTTDSQNITTQKPQIKNMTAVTTDQPYTEPGILQKQLTTPSPSSAIPPARDCQDIAARGITSSGPYVITPPDGLGSFEVYCDFETDNEGWIVFQKRLDGSVDFFRNWTDYEHGFGNASGEYWLGLKNIRRLTSDSTTWALRIDLESFDGETAYATYDTFAVSDAASKYTLSVGEYSGCAGDSLKYAGFVLNGMQFSTYDQDNDATSSNCAKHYKGGWWYNACYRAHLNGPYLGPADNSGNELMWYTWKEYQPMKSTQMKIKRV